MKNQILFTKYSNDRNEKFAIRTQIMYDENHQKQVRKSPITAAAAEHVRKISYWEKALNDIYSGTGLSMNVCHGEENGVVFEFLEGITLENELDRYLEMQDLEGLLDRAGEFFNILRNVRNQKGFVKTEKFTQVFGEVELPQNLMCAPVTDIDMVFGNVMIINGAMQLIDYEWTFDFPIPVNFVIYRAIHYYIHLGNARPQLLSMDLYGRFGIEQKEIEQYEKMEQCFQKYIIRDFTPLRLLYDRISPGCVSVTEAVSAYTNKMGRGNLQVFWDLGDGFSEKNSVKLRTERDGYFDAELILPKDAEWIRLDPGEDCGILHIEAFRVDGTEVSPIVSEGWILDTQTVIFFKDDPQLLVRKPQGRQVMMYFRAYMEKGMEECAQKLINILREGQSDKEKLQQLHEKHVQLSLEMKHLKAENSQLCRKMCEMEQLKAENNQLYHKIREMEETKIWKAYRKYRNVIEKGQ